MNCCYHEDLNTYASVKSKIGWFVQGKCIVNCDDDLRKKLEVMFDILTKNNENIENNMNIDLWKSKFELIEWKKVQ